MGATVPENNLVAYTLDGLSFKFQYIKTTICPKDPLPTFWENWSMLLLEEASMAQDQSCQNLASHFDHALSAIILSIDTLASNTPNRSTNNFKGA